MVKVSVLLPVYNVEKFIAEAVESILRQTFTDFELIVIDDASTDDTVQILNSFQDGRLQLHVFNENRMHAYRLNQAIDLAQGDYLAIMHGDDIAHPERLAKQVELLDRHPEVGVCGTWYSTFGESDEVMCPPKDDRDIRLMHLVNNSALGHPTVMLRRSVLLKSDLRYDSERVPAEDYWLWVQLGLVTRLANVPEVLLSYRIHPQQIGKLKGTKQLLQAQAARDFFAGCVLGRALTVEEQELNRILYCRSSMNTSEQMQRFHHFIAALIDGNQKTKLLDQKLLETTLQQIYHCRCKEYVTCYYLLRQRFNVRNLIEFLGDRHASFRYIPSLQRLKFLTKCLIGYECRS